MYSNVFFGGYIRPSARLNSKIPFGIWIKYGLVSEFHYAAF